MRQMMKIRRERRQVAMTVIRIVVYSFFFS